MQNKIQLRFVNLLIVLLLASNSVAAVHAASQAAISQANAITFKPVADAYVLQTSPGSNYGKNTALRVDSSPITRSYLRFVVSGLSGRAVQSVILSMYANSSNKTGFSVQSVATIPGQKPELLTATLPQREPRSPVQKQSVEGHG